MKRRYYHLPPPRPLPTGVDGLVNDLVGWWRRLPWHLRQCTREVDRVSADLPPLASQSDAQLQLLIAEQRAARLRMPEARQIGMAPTLALLAEVAKRTVGLTPHAVQLVGVLVIYRGLLAEMSTGEGKTLVAALAAVLYAWHGKPCHLVTANDYLAARDAQRMAPLFAYCGVQVAAITSEMAPEERIRHYQADVVYITAKELLGDYLRDRLAGRRQPTLFREEFYHWLGKEVAQEESLLQVRGLHSVLIDEADSVMIDEAETALILSVPRDQQGIATAVLQASQIAELLQEGVDYRVVHKKRLVHLLASAQERLANEWERLPPLWRAPARREELLRQALVARIFFKRDHNYVVQEGKIVLLDEYTGRMTPNRTLMAGLHQAIEAREGLPISAGSETLAQMSFQVFFRQFIRLSGMTGTCREAVGEFWRIYGLAGWVIPTHRPVLRRQESALVFVTAEAKWQAIVARVESCHGIGQPVLIGTRSVQASEQLAVRLQQRGLPFELLNAVRHHDEARIIAGAGVVGRITIATNMAGRGTDIQLGPGAAERGGLLVIVTEMHDAGRIDRQLIGRCGRQGDPGSVAMFLSLADELVLRYVPDGVRKLLGWLIKRQMSGANSLARLAFRLAQRKAEQQAFQRRQQVLQMDRWLESALPFE